MSYRQRLCALLLAVASVALPTVVSAAPSAAATAQATERSVAAGFRNPVKEAAADPQVVRYNGNYYLTYTRNDNIAISRASSVAGFATAPETVVWRDTTSSRCCGMWAPELHFLNGRWYIYYTATDSSNAVGNHRMYVVESAGPDPLGPYTFKGALAAAADQYSLDGTVLRMPDGRLYAIWSGWAPGTTGPQNLYIAPLANPWTTSGPRVLLSRPQYAWETDHAPVNEGAAVLWRGDRLFLAYSASGCSSPNYALGLLTFTGGDVLNPASWVKSPEPQFRASAANVAYSTAHNSFFTSPDGTETWMVYHGVVNPNGSCGDDRATRIQKVTWRADGTPNFGVPAATWTTLALPSGDPGVAGLPDGDYVLTAVHSGRVADVAEAGSQDGANVLQWDYHGAENQVWRLRGLADGTYELRARHSDKLLDAQRGVTDGADVVQRGADGSAYQRWYIDAVAGGAHRLSVQATGRALDVDHAIADNGANVLTWQYLYAPNQKWRLEPVSRIMPLGDSITYGGGDGTSYRTELWRRLMVGSPKPNLVGSVVSGTVADPEHEGHPGWRIDEVSAQVNAWLAAARPDTVLLHIGTNDMNQNYDVANAPARLGALIDQILAAAPGVRVVVASIIPANDPAVERRVQTYNAAIPELVRARAAAGEKVTHVDMHAVLTTEDLADALHPNPTGYTKMGAAWATALGR